MKRIALFPSAFHPNLGGVEELTGQLALHLKKNGIESLICVNKWPRNLPTIDQWKGFLLRRFPFRLPENGIKSNITFYLSRRRILKDVIAALVKFEAEAVHVQCVSSNAWYAFCAAKHLGLPLIVSVQGERRMDVHDIYGKSAIYNRLLRRILSGANKVTACSAATLRDVEGFMGSSIEGKGRVIYNGVGREAFEPGPKWPHPRRYLLALGRLVPQKGFSLLVEAFAKANLREVDLLIAGDGPDADLLRKSVKELRLGERVHFIGRAQREMVHALMCGACGLVVPSLREPMGIVALEGMAAGKPLLVSSVDGLKEVAPEGEWCRQFLPGNVNALSRGLIWLAGVDAAAMGPIQQEHAGQFLWDKIVRQYIDVYCCARDRFPLERALVGVEQGR